VNENSRKKKRRRRKEKKKVGQAEAGEVSKFPHTCMREFGNQARGVQGHYVKGLVLII